MRDRSALLVVASLRSLLLAGSLRRLRAAARPDPGVPSPGRRSRARPRAVPQPAAPSGKGSSDGTTCEQARDSYVEEVNVGARGQSRSQRRTISRRFSTRAPTSSRAPSEHQQAAHLCRRAERSAVGVTVAAEPSAPDVEICVAKEVRKLAFPSHIKMDVVNVQF